MKVDAGFGKRDVRFEVQPSFTDGTDRVHFQGEALGDSIAIASGRPRADTSPQPPSLVGERDTSRPPRSAQTHP
jgi:hypothetical protein